MAAVIGDVERVNEHLKYNYTEKHFIWEIPAWNTDNNTRELSKFDQLLHKQWNGSMAKGFFNYNLDHVKTKILEGNMGFVTQLNNKRESVRRKPQEFYSVTQASDPSLFNFSKIKKGEILFELIPSRNSDNLNDDEKVENSYGHFLIINVSPLEFGNSLLVPHLALCRPQILTHTALKMAVELILLSNLIDFRLVYNSLCGYASVNHLHFHAYYLNHKLPLENLSLQHISGDCYETKDYVAPAFVFCLTNHDISRLVESSMKLINFLLKRDVPHNLFITRGIDSECEKSDLYSTIRIYVWVKFPVLGSKPEDSFNAASCELGGHLVIKSSHSKDCFNPAASGLGGHLVVKTEEKFNSLTEEEACKILRDSAESKFLELRPEIEKLFS